MTPTPDDAKAIVARGYDAIAERYIAWSATVGDGARARYTRLLLDALPAGAAILELGCGAGTPTTRRLAARFAVTGVDLSPRQISLARRHVPQGRFMVGDMTTLTFPAAAFDAVCAFYAITHVPREEHAGLLAKIAAWLRPGGLFVASFSNGGTPGEVEDDWLGAPMYFSGYDAETNRRLVRAAGLVIERARAETHREFGRPTTFFWIVARTPRGSDKREEPMTDGAALKAAAQREVEQVSRMLIGCSDWMAENPELGLQEYQASAKLTEMLEEFGAEVERGIAGLDTAFHATLPGGNPDGPTIAIIAEYDALPDVGHGCGHNIIANAAIGAGIALARLGQQGLLPGRVVVLGTPAEESAVPNAGGKIPVLEQGYFAGVDAAIMIHPQTEDFIALKPSMVAYGIDFMFHGRAAHAAANPHTGINALDAVIQTFNNVGMLRQQVRSEARIHGVVTSGGGAPNVIPPYAACRFRIRSYDPVYAAALKQRVVACAEGAATATGARLEWKEYIKPYQSYVPNRALGAVMRANMEEIGRDVQDGPPHEGGGSTDFGNVSHDVPAVYAYIGICGEEAGWHSREVAAATKTARGHASLIAGAKTMAMTAIDLLTNPDTLVAAKKEHAAAMAPIREGLAQVNAGTHA